MRIRFNNKTLEVDLASYAKEKEITVSQAALQMIRTALADHKEAADEKTRRDDQ